MAVTTPKVLRRREKEMDLKLPFAKAPIDLPELLIHLALKVGLPVDAVKKIRNEFLSSWWGRVAGTRNRRLTHNPYGTSFLWAGEGILAETERGGRHTNELYWTRIWCTWGVGFVSVNFKFGKFKFGKFGLQP